MSNFSTHACWIFSVSVTVAEYLFYIFGKNFLLRRRLSKAATQGVPKKKQGYRFENIFSAVNQSED